MTDTVQRKTWRLAKSGDVKYQAPHQDASLDGLNSLSQDIRNGIRATVLIQLSKKGDVPENLEVRYDLKTAAWRSESGPVSEADLGISRSVLEKRLDEAATDLNRIQVLPQQSHQRVVELTPLYDSGFTVDRPDRVSKASLRAWRRADEEWMKSSLEASAIQPEAKDMFDLACDLLARLDRPSDLLWELDASSDGRTHLALYSTRHLLHAVPYIVRTKLTLGVDKSLSVDASTNQRLILLSELLAFAQAIRLFAAGMAGDLVLTAYEVDDLSQCATPTPIVQIQIHSDGWLSEMSKLIRTSTDIILGMSNRGLSVVLPTDENWIGG